MQPIFGIHSMVKLDPPFQTHEKRRPAGLHELELVQKAQVQRHHIACIDLGQRAVRVKMAVFWQEVRRVRRDRQARHPARSNA